MCSYLQVIVVTLSQRCLQYTLLASSQSMRVRLCLTFDKKLKLAAWYVPDQVVFDDFTNMVSQCLLLHSSNQFFIFSASNSSKKSYLSVCSYHATYAFQSESTLWLPECQGTPCSKQARNLKFKWLQLDSNPLPLSS